MPTPSSTPSAPPGFPIDRFRRLRHPSGRPPCPHCDATHVHRWGSFAGRRRYRCVTCHRTFSDFTATPLAYLKRIDRWPQFCRCTLESLTVRRTAERLGIHKNTAFRWRHRLLAALAASDVAPLGSSVTVHETWFPYSEKGKRGLQRPPRRRAAWHRYQMTPVWVFVAHDGFGRLAAGVVGPHRPMAGDLADGLASRLAPSAELLSRFGPYGAAGVLAVRIGRPYRRVDSRSPELAPVRQYIMSLRRWIRRFRGVATRYLDNYLAWHRYLHLLGSSRARTVVVPPLLAGKFP